MSKYYFEVNVREGAPGWADDDEYIGGPFDTFGEAYRALFYFEPCRYWYHLRYVSSMKIWLDGNRKVDVSTGGSYLIELEDLIHLNVTEAEFDVIIAIIDKEQGNTTDNEEEKCEIMDWEH